MRVQTHYFKAMRATLPKKGEGPRPAWSYRATRRNAGHACKWIALRDERLTLGLTRRQYDIMRGARLASQRGAL